MDPRKLIGLSRRLQFEGAAPVGAIRLLSDKVDSTTLAEGNTIALNLARVMSFRDPWYGKVELTKKKLQDMIKNFDANTYGQKIFIDVAHNPSNGAAAEIIKLRMDGLKFMGDVVFTAYGLEAVKEKGFVYLSIDFTENYTDPETEKEHGPLLFGAGLTIRPRVKRIDPITLSFDQDEQPMLVTLHARHLLTEENNLMFDKIWKKLQEKLKALKLSEAVISQYNTQLKTIATTLGDNEEALQAVADSFEGTAVTLSENGQGASDSIRLDFSSLNMPAASPSMTADDVRRLLAEDRETQATNSRQLQERQAANVLIFSTAIAAAEGLSDEVRQTLSESQDLITAEMSADQVTRLAEHQIKLGNSMMAQSQLGNMGYQARGTVIFTESDRSTAITLQEQILGNLRKTSRASTMHLSDNVSPFADMVLSEFDRLNAPRIAAERKTLAAGTTSISDSDLPVGFQRTVIREALSDLRVLDLIQTLTDFGATATTQIPYEVRDMSAIYNNGIVYEAGEIHRASITQAMDNAYISPMKIAFLISNEVMHFSRASSIDWDAYARNLESNARVLRELIALRICNELQRAADSYLASTVAAEDISAQLDGATVSIVKTANFPIVRQHQVRDLQGTAIGSATNAMTVKLNSVAIDEYDGTGTQAAGSYYRVINYNLGYVQYVDETGTPITPVNSAGADTIGYDYATNVATFDLDNGTTDLDVHLNGLLRTIGARKAVLANDRYSVPDYMLMSYVLNDTVTNAKQFVSSNSKPGTSQMPDGDLERVKGTSAFSSNAPNVDLGDERILIGQRSALTYTVAKPFQTGAPFEAVGANGKPTGQKQAYGEEYSAIKVPNAIRNRMTSVIAYSATARAAV